jgi:phospholipid-translocating ATPase
MANCYFLFIVILELFFATVSDAMISLAPLLFVVGVSMIKDIIEDRTRYLSDQEENDRTTDYSALGQNRFTECQAREIKVGCFVKVKTD